MGEPTVELGDGRSAVRLDHTAVDWISYIVRADDGIVSAAFAGWDEVVFADWFTDASRQPIDQIAPPTGFTLVPDLLSHRFTEWPTVPLPRRGSPHRSTRWRTQPQTRPAGRSPNATT